MMNPPHRSFEARGIDREPTQHLGPVASDMERKGKASRIGDENRQAHANNIERIADYVERAEMLTGIDYQKARHAPESKPIGTPDLASEKSNTDRVLDKYRADAKRPWDSAIKSNDNNRRPWDSDLSRDADGGGRERSPSSGGPKNSKG